MIYLDNAAATPPTEEILNFYKKQYLKYFANQEAIHTAGYDVRKELEKAKSITLKNLIETDDAEIMWTASGTESLNLSLRQPSLIAGNIITTNIEHAALAEAIRHSGAEIKKVRVLSNGQIDLAHLEELIDDKTTLLATHHVHSETGSIQNLCEISKVLKNKNFNAKLLVDTVQSAGKMEIPWNECQLDFIYVAAHKIGGTAGSAIIYRKDDTIHNFFIELRKKYHAVSRAEPANILALSQQIKMACGFRNGVFAKMYKYNSNARKELSQIELFNKKKILFTTELDESSPFILNFILPDYQAGVIVRMLSQKDIMISSGSACESETKEPSRALTEMGYNKNDAFGALRVSFWDSTTEDEIQNFIYTLKEIIKDY